MIKISEIESFLATEGLLSDRGGTRRSETVTSVTSTDSAGPDDLSWISEKAWKRNPQAGDGFSGAALIVPSQWKSESPAAFSVLHTTQPKLALVRVLNRFFSDKAETRFPKVGAYPIAGDARLADDVVLAAGVVIGSGVQIAAGVSIGPNTVLANCTIGEGTQIGANCTIGLSGFGYEKTESGEYVRFPHIGRVCIGRRVEIGSNTCLDRGALGDTILEDGCKIDNLVHVAHNVRVGKNALIIANSMLGGSATVGESAWIAPSASLMNQIKIGEHAVIGLGAVVLKNVEARTTMVGNPAKPLVR